LGESEKLVRALFAAARFLQPSVIFIDEIDSLLSSRSSSEHEASRRLKTEFLVQFDGVSSSSEDRVLVMGATNRPQDLDEAARRRLVKRIYIPLPDKETRVKMIKSLLDKESNCKVAGKEIEQVAASTDGYSCADLTNLCKDAAMEPVRELGLDIANIAANKVRPIQLKDFKPALEHIRPSVSKQTLQMFEEWNNDFGSISV
jgi:SpoVK/Ycf46/Vps4 family AAA+-type ATPase